MTNIYFVTRWDAYNDEYSEHLVALYLDKQEALNYAAACPLEHEERVTVEEKCLGLQKEWTGYIYQRQHYDHTQALFSMLGWFPIEIDNIDELIGLVVSKLSPMLVAEVDFSKLYQLYMETWAYDKN